MKAFRPAARPLALALALVGAAPAFAVSFEMDNGVKGSLDTTISYGYSVRTNAQDPTLIGIANGGTSRSVNEDDGDLNFKPRSPFANILKATSEVEVKYRNFGFFGRGTAYIDFQLYNSDKLGPTGKKRLGKDFVGLDGFVFGSFTPLDHTLRVRVGRQVISWGESTFISNGINIINPVDVSRLRIPGSELKEGFIPTTGIWSSLELTKGASIEGFYLTNHDRIKLDPRGSYFSNNDFASDDANHVFVTFGRRKDEHFALTNPIPPTTPGAGPVAQALYGPFDPAASVWANRSDDHPAKDDGQYGVAFRYLAHALNNTEFGLYHINYHSRIPLFSGRTGTPATASSSLTSIVTGGPLNAAQNGTATYFAEYPENIKLYGLSLNTQGPAGIAIQGEYSYRPNLPVQYATPELLLATVGGPNLITGFTQLPGQATGATAAALFPPNTYMQGYKRLKMSQAQATLTKSWPNVLRAEQAVLVAEAGANWFHNLPTDVRFNGPAVYLPATALGALVSAGGSMQTEGFLTNFSWGYRLAGRLEYANAFAGGNVAPRFAYTEDVKGIGPNFNQNVRSASLGLSWDYQRKWVVDAQYTSYWGGRIYCGTDVSGVPPTQPATWCSSNNPLKDRDFYSLSVSYSF